MGLRGLDGLSSTPLMPCLPLKAGKLTSLGQVSVDRVLSNSRAEPSGRLQGKSTQVKAQLFRPPIFDPRKLTTTYLPGASGTEPQPPAPRRYTLTHNDITGQLNLSIGRNYNTMQVSGWYTRLIRDEVLAEWCHGSNGNVKLHVYCHVSGEERWLAPPALRNYIFQREMPLVLDTILHADRLLFEQLPGLAGAAVVVHLSSHLTDLNMSVEWGTLSERASWPVSKPSLLRMLWRSLAERSQTASAAEVQQLVSLSDSITEQLGQTRMEQLEPVSVSVSQESRQTSTDVLMPSSLRIEEPHSLPEPLLIGMDAESYATDSPQQCTEGCASAAADSSRNDSSSCLGDDSMAKDAEVGGSLAALSVSSADAEPGRLHDYNSTAAGSSWDPVSPSDQEGGSRGSSTPSGITDSRGKQSHKQSALRSSTRPKSGIMLPEGNILEFDHGGSERRPGALQIATASSSVSEWLASGYEVISVRL